MEDVVRMSEVRFTVPLTPPSVNSYVRHTRSGSHYVSKEALAFKQAIAVFAKGQRCAGKFYQLDVDIFYGKGERGDLDNRAKCIQDGLEDAGVIVSDAFITALSMRKHRDPKNPRTEIRVTSL